MPKAMIITVGGTVEPIIKAIGKYRPDFISFLASQDTCDKIAEIRTCIEKDGLRPKREITLSDDANDLLHCHEKADEAVARVMQRGYSRGDVVVDYIISKLVSPDS